MTSNIDQELINKVIYSHSLEFKQMLDNFIRSRLIQNTMLFQTNEKEIEALNDIVEKTSCSISMSDGGISLNINFDEKENWWGIVTGGMSAPLTGGNGGIAHNPDGSTYSSKVPEALQGNPIPQFAKQGIDIESEMKMMAKDLFIDIVNEIISSSSDEIAEAVKPYIVQEINNALGGG